LRVFLYFIGKARDEHANAIAAEFVKRTTRYCSCEMREIRPDRVDILARHPSARKIFLDPDGRTLNTAEFVHLVERAEREARDLVFLIGGQMVCRLNGNLRQICCSLYL
jgi:23S rRNA (pseudouridine1915-N3)-methyltransferase